MASILVACRGRTIYVPTVTVCEVDFARELLLHLWVCTSLKVEGQTMKELEEGKLCCCWTYSFVHSSVLGSLYCCSSAQQASSLYFVVLNLTHVMQFSWGYVIIPSESLCLLIKETCKSRGAQSIAA